MKRTVIALVLAFPVVLAAGARADDAAKPDWPKFEPLWPSGAPGAFGKEDKDTPAMMVFLPPASAPRTGTGVVIYPGGGYWTVALGHEGVDVARFLNGLGVAAFVVRYRHAPYYRHPIPLTDAQRALRIVRSRAEAYGLVGDRIGVMGFSAGGHLAATVSTRFDGGNLKATDAIERASARPDFTILGYPVISFVAPYAHGGSADGLVGKDGDVRLLEELSADKRVTAWSPPTFLFHTSEDNGVPAENSISYYLALRAARVPAELHVYEKGKHGVGLAPSDPILSSWAGRLSDWLKTRGLLDAPEPCKVALGEGKRESPITRACKAGGIPAAKVRMRELVASAKAHGRGFACEDCHGKEGLLPDAGKKFELLLKAAARR